MTNTYVNAQKELEILSKEVPGAVILPFSKEILNLCEAFGKSGQSGMSAPMVASALSQAIKKLLLQEPICEITGRDEEWVDVAYVQNSPLFQNSRCSGIFKQPEGCSYVDAIVWQGEERWDTFTGRVYVDDTLQELIGSSQYVTFPFTPKTFYVDVVRRPVSKALAESKGIHFIEDGFGECYYTILKDPSQLDEVFKYYTKKLCK